MGLRKPRKLVKFGQWYLSEIVARSLSYKTFAGYRHCSTYHFYQFSSIRRLHRGPKFSHNYLIDCVINYTIGFIIDLHLVREHRKVHCYWGYD